MSLVVEITAEYGYFWEIRAEYNGTIDNLAVVQVFG